MGILRLPGLVQTTQPQSGPIELDPGNPITRGIDVAFVRLDQLGIIGNATLTKGGSASLLTTKYGQGWYFGNTTSDLFNSSGWPVLPDGTEYTYLVVTQLTATGTTGMLVNGDNTIRSFQFRIETSGAPGFIGFNTAVTTFSAVGTVIPVGQVQAIVARSATAAVTVFQNGRKTATTAATGTIKGQSASDIQIGNRLTANLRGSIGLVIRWPRALSDAEAQAISANPWQLFRSPQRVMLASGAGPDVTLALTGQGLTSAGGTLGSSATVPVAGSSATVARGTIAPSLSLAVTGQSVAASRGTVAPALSVGMTGQSAQALRGSVSVSGTADVTVALSGQALTASRGTMAPSAAKALTGQAQSVQRGLLAPARAIVISGQSSTVQRGSVSPSNNVTVALTGQAAATAQGSISPFATSRAVLNGTTIMRASVTNNSVPRLVASIAASGGTMRASAAGSTIMRASPINSTGRMSNSAINCTANLL